MSDVRENSVVAGEETQPPVARDVRSQTPNIIILDRQSAERLSLSPYRDTRREKSPFEIGPKKNIQIASQKAVIDKAAIMDITGVTSRVAKSVDEFIQFYVNDYSIIDKASVLDISPALVKIVIVEEDEPEEEKPEADSEDLDKKKLRLKKMKMRLKLKAATALTRMTPRKVMMKMIKMERVVKKATKMLPLRRVNQLRKLKNKSNL